MLSLRLLLVLLLLGAATLLIVPSRLAAQPNIVFVLADDLDIEHPANGWNKYTRLRNLLTKQGTTFRNSFVSLSLCCPSRLSILRGQYAHNTGVFDNEAPYGGFPVVHELGLELSTIATWLQAAGYRTVLMGKYLNAYPSDPPGATYIPPGWSEWFVGPGGKYGQFNYDLNENGTLVRYGASASDYMQDVLRGKAIDFIERNAARPDRPPFFLFFSSYSPHTPATYAPRHQNLFPNAIAPRVPTFNQPDVSGLPAWMRAIPLLTTQDISAIDALYRNRLRSMVAVAETVDAIIAKLAETGDLANTFIFFTSDNGFQLGQHRWKPGKNQHFEEDVRVPLIVRGPGVRAGRTLAHMTLNIDFAATFAELAGIPIPESVDGRSLVPLLGTTPPPVSSWRKAFLMERGWNGRPQLARASQPRATPEDALEPPDAAEAAAVAAAAPNPAPAFDGIHTARYTYLEYPSGVRPPELYDNVTDPYQSREVSASASPALLANLSRWLGRLRGCTGQNCRAAEDNTPQ